jgi:hypothetical protein
MLQHPLRRCVQIQARHHRDVGPDDRTHPRQQLALPVVGVLRHHRAVQIEIHRVQLPAERRASRIIATMRS